jgi:dTDP-glucose 4,6-dehydratase
MGFIGSNFIRMLLSRYNDLKVINVDNLSYGSDLRNLHDLDEIPNYRFLRRDVCSLTASECVDVDAIVNLAAQSHVDRSISNPKSFIESNIVGAFNLLELCRMNDMDYLQVSTDEVYGSSDGQSLSEGDSINPSSPYSATKAAADLLVESYFRTYGLRAMITRSTNNYGPFQFPEKFIPKTIIRALKNLPIPLYGTGQQVRDWLHVVDNCEALDLVLRNGQAGEIYNIAGGNQISNLEVVVKVLELLGKPKSLLQHVEDRPGHDFRYNLNASKIEHALAWKGKIRFLDGVKATVEWYVNNEDWWRPIASEKILSESPWKENW